MATKAAIETVIFALSGYKPIVDDIREYTLQELAEAYNFVKRYGFQRLIVRKDSNIYLGGVTCG